MEKVEFGGGLGWPCYLVSACLLGLRTRYDGQAKASSSCLARVGAGVAIPVCPEQLGGLPTPRTAAAITGGDGHGVWAGQARVLTRLGADVTPAFILGAEQVLAIAGRQPLAGVFLKGGSPSCGVRGIVGVTAALLQREGYLVEEF